MLKSNLGIGPLSSEIIEAVFRHSNYQRTELMLIASKNQIDHSGGYVNSWTTSQYANFIRNMKEKYKFSSVKVCRDHCGPGFNGVHDLEDTYKTIETDIKNGFDLIHIDFCHFKGHKDERFNESKKAIERCLSLNPKILLEVGTDENTGINFGFMNVPELREEISFFKGFCDPEFYVVQTGSLVKEINQVGNFNKRFIEKVRPILRENSLRLKEHNADYLSKEEISERIGIVDAMNIAPQLGVVHTSVVLGKCLEYGIRFDDFIEEVYKGEKWKKWMHSSSPENKFLCALIAGHYHFASDSYKKIIGQLEKRMEIQETIINTIMEVIEHYQSAYDRKKS